MDVNEIRVKAIWRQENIPVIARRSDPGKKHWLKIPFERSNRSWIQNGRRVSPHWIGEKKLWETPKSWFNDLVERSLTRFGSIYVIQPYREMEKCARACQNAVGHECNCSCMGANHGIHNDGSWFEVSDAFSCRWGPRQIACRLMTKKDRPVSFQDLDV